MQPCSHPLYGLIEASNGTSGDSLCATIERVRSGVTVVCRGGGGASACPQPSSNGAPSRTTGRKRGAGFERAPRPGRAGEGAAGEGEDERRRSFMVRLAS